MNAYMHMHVCIHILVVCKHTQDLVPSHREFAHMQEVGKKNRQEFASVQRNMQIYVQKDE